MKNTFRLLVQSHTNSFLFSCYSRTMLTSSSTTAVSTRCYRGCFFGSLKKDSLGFFLFFSSTNQLACLLLGALVYYPALLLCFNIWFSREGSPTLHAWEKCTCFELFLFTFYPAAGGDRRRDRGIVRSKYRRVRVSVFCFPLSSSARQLESMKTAYQ